MALSFSDLSTDAGLQQANAYLASRVYVFGNEPTVHDVTLSGLIGGNVNSSKYPNVVRYANHIASFSAAEKAAFPNIEFLSVSVGVAAAPAPAPAPAKKKKGLLDSSSDDDSSSDEGESAAAVAQRKAEEKKKSVNAAKKKRRPPARSEIIFDVKPFSDETDLEALAAKIKKVYAKDYRGKELPGINDDGMTWDDLEKKGQEQDERVTLEDGMKWGLNHNLIPIGYGLKKLQVQMVCQDEIIGGDVIIDLLMDTFPNDIQSVDIAGFQKM
jgi:elongation factor 1-beta